MKAVQKTRHAIALAIQLWVPGGATAQPLSKKSYSSEKLIFIDSNENGIWDDSEEYIDNPNGVWYDDEEFVDELNGVYDDGEELSDEYKKLIEAYKRL